MSTITITTAEQCEAMLKLLDHLKATATPEQEKSKPIKWMICTCCGEDYKGRQWFNQDAGYGMGDCCAKWADVESHGWAGIHYLIQGANK